jgi:Rad3-related DNA helicase
MITDRAKQLIELIEEKNKLYKYANQLDSFKTRQQQIEKAVSDILPFANTLRVFRQKNILDCDLVQKVEKFLYSVNLILEKFKESPEWIVDSQNFDGNILERSIRAITKELNEQLIQAWENYLAEKMPSTNQEMLNVLVKIEAFRPNVQRIRDLNAQIQRQKLPQNYEEFEHIERLIDQLREHWLTLSSDDFPETVLHFLKATVDFGAPLNLLTTEVRDWLDCHGISDSLRIRLTQ